MSITGLFLTTITHFTPYPTSTTHNYTYEFPLHPITFHHVETSLYTATPTLFVTTPPPPPTHNPYVTLHQPASLYTVLQSVTFQPTQLYTTTLSTHFHRSMSSFPTYTYTTNRLSLTSPYPTLHPVGSLHHPTASHFLSHQTSHNQPTSTLSKPSFPPPHPTKRKHIPSTAFHPKHPTQLYIHPHPSRGSLHHATASHFPTHPSSHHKHLSTLSHPPRLITTTSPYPTHSYTTHRTPFTPPYPTVHHRIASHFSIHPTSHHQPLSPRSHPPRSPPTHSTKPTPPYPSQTHPTATLP